MKLRKSLFWLLLLLILSVSPTLAAIPSGESLPVEPGWELVAPGVEFRQFQLPDPNDVFVVRMDRTNLSLTLESTTARGDLVGSLETVSGMFARYDQALNYWGGSSNPVDWGMRNQVVVAINGSFFNSGSGEPQNGQVQSGWYVKHYQNYGGKSGFAWKLDRSAFIGECVYHHPEKQTIFYPATGITQPFTDVNRSRGENELILFTPQYDSSTGTDDSGVEVLVEMERPTMILPEPAYAKGFVRQIWTDRGDSLIPFNFIVLSANGTAAQTLLENVQEGSEVHVSQEITPCDGTSLPSWTKTYASLQGSYYFLKDGQINDITDTNYHPRTAIAFNDQYIFFIVVDGRHRYHSIGMTVEMLAIFSRDVLGATYAVAQDGGGSSTMVINGRRMNNTYCNQWGCLGEYTTAFLPLVVRDLQDGQVVSENESIARDIETGHERSIANGMLMVIAQPAEYSLVYHPDDAVKTLNDIQLRLGPGTNYAAFTTLPSGTEGVVVEQVNGLDGVLAKSTYWWFVDFGGVLGWVPEGALAPVNTSNVNLP